MFENWILKPPTDQWNKQRKTLSLHKRQKESSLISKEINFKNQIDFDIKCDELKENGVMQVENFISKKQAKEMYNYFMTKKCYDFYGIHQSFNLDNVPNHVKLGRHTIKDNLLCPNMIDLITNEKLTKIASSYLGCPATLSLVLPMWSFPQVIEQPINMQLYHRDADDYKFVKFFILLSDVEIGEGEQVYIKGSHIKDDLPKNMYEIVRYTSEQVYEHFEHEQAKTIFGESGTSWFADTYGIHRGTVPKSKNRLILQLQFTYADVPIFNYNSYRYSKWKELSDLIKYSTRLYIRE